MATAMILISVFVANSANTDAATGWTTHHYYYNCNDQLCRCPSWATSNCNIHVHTCINGFTTVDQADGGTRDVCYDNPRLVATIAPGQTMGMDSILSGIDCTYTQVDLNRPEDSSIIGFYGAATFEWTDWSICDQEGEPPTPPPPPTSQCPYDSTQARVHENVSKPWVKDLTLKNCPTSVIVGAFHDHTGQFANDTVIQVVGPNMNLTLGNEAIFATGATGTYTVYAKTKIPGTNNFYSEPACNAKATVTCAKAEPEDDDTDPDFEVSKIATNEDGAYDIGDLVDFRVTIENTGEETLNTISFRDVFDSNYLELLRITGHSPSNPGGIDMTDAFSLSQNGTLVTLSNTDITSLLGNLPINQTIYLDFEFRAVNPSSRACNDVFASANGLSEEQARDCVGITISTDL